MHTTSTTITATQMQQKSGEIIRRAMRQGETFLVERGGIPTVVILPFNAYQALREQARQSIPTKPTSPSPR